MSDEIKAARNYRTDLRAVPEQERDFPPFVHAAMAVVTIFAGVAVACIIISAIYHAVVCALRSVC